VVFVHGLFSSADTWTSFKRLVITDPELADFVTAHCFKYDSPFIRLRVDRRIAEIDDIADRLRTYLFTEIREVESIVLVSHSQGGLVVQRFLARTLWSGQGRELARIKQITMYACPNSGSEFFLSVRKSLFFWRNPQERQLRPFVRAVVEAQQTVLRSVVHARGCTDTECHIPISAYGGISDKIVPPSVSTWVFPSNGVVDGDHFSVVRPADRGASSYRVLQATLRSAGGPVDPPTAVVVDLAAERNISVSVAPPFGRRDDPLRGRESLIASIMSNKGSKVYVLAGLGGSGKKPPCIRDCAPCTVRGTAGLVDIDKQDQLMHARGCQSVGCTEQPGRKGVAGSG
jgi:pimeloyl-ACP methyl ester carboxylesterase